MGIAQSGNNIRVGAEMKSSPTITSTYYYSIDLCDYSTGRVLVTRTSAEQVLQAGNTFGLQVAQLAITDFLKPTGSTTYLVKAHLYGTRGANTILLASGEGTFVYTSDN